MSIKKLEDFELYDLAMCLGEDIFGIVKSFKYFDNDTIGKQLVRSADSIAANLSEGLGRFHYKEQKNFTYYARGSLFEIRTWLTKASNRKLLTKEQYAEFIHTLEMLGLKLNNYLKSIGPKT